MFVKIQPHTLTLIITFKCSSSCDNCCFGCTPKRNEKLPLEQAKRHIFYAYKTYPSIKVVILTGGECLLDMEYITELIRYIYSFDLMCRIVTNGFWAGTRVKAKNVLRHLLKSGLSEINFSTGDEHQRYVPTKNIVNGVLEALSLGLPTVVNIETGEGKDFNAKIFLAQKEILKLLSSDLDKKHLFSIVSGLWMPFTQNAIKKLPLLDKGKKGPFMGRCTNILTGIVVSPSNQMLSCCGLPVMDIEEFHIGSLYNGQINTYFEKEFADFFKIWLFVEGPYKILSFLGESLGFVPPECRVVSHMCFYCACLCTNRKYAMAVRTLYKKKFISVMIQYQILARQYELL